MTTKTIEFPGYEILSKVNESEKNITYRAERWSDKERVLLKTFLEDFPKSNEIALLKQEYLVLKKLINEDGIVHVLDFVEEKNYFAIIFKDIPGICLTKWMKKNQVTIDDFFIIALQAGAILDNLFRNNIIHKNIKPENIIIDPETLKIYLTDFSIASVLKQESLTSLNPSVLEGTLTYISPEQTGRINRPVDFRSDYYSLGITLFELLAGKPPFQSDDPLDLVYSHIAKPPPALSDLNPDVPAVVSEIIHKLIAKNQADRYQSGSGLLADLTEAFGRWKQHGNIPPFPIGLNDFNQKLTISNKLYGRANEIKNLEEMIKDISSGQGGIITVTGYSGIGKTSLVMELQKKMLQKHAGFTSGKFDQLQRNNRYEAVSQAFHHLVHQLLSEPDDQLKLWRSKISVALGRTGKLLTNLIPELELLIGKQPDLEPLDPKNAKKQFISTIEKFICCFATAENPLILFFDDMQWADAHSLELIEELVTGVGSKFYILILSYRNNEVTENHPLMVMLNAIVKNQVKVEKVELFPLEKSDVDSLLQDTLNSENVSLLSDQIFKKTKGNPFFVKQCLKDLYSEKLLYFDVSKHQWVWDLDRIESLELSDNVIDLVAKKIKTLPEQTIETLKIASCFGNRFDLNSLQIASQKKMSELSLELWNLLENEFIVPLDATYKRLLLGAEFETLIKEKVVFKFLHDKVQQAAYDLLSEDEKNSYHYKIGKFLIIDKNIDENHDANRDLYDTLVHFLNCLSLIKELDEKLFIAKLFLLAGKGAKVSVAHNQAVIYFKAGLRLLEPHDWTKNYELLFSTYYELAESEYILEHFDSAIEDYNEIIRNVKNKYDEAVVYKSLIQMHAINKHPEDAVDAGIKALNLLGVSINKNVGKLKILYQFFAVVWRMHWYGLDYLAKSLPLMKDKHWQLVSDIIEDMIEPANRTHQNLLVYLGCLAPKIVLQHGLNHHAPLTLSEFLFIHFTVLPRSQLNFELVTAADEMSKRVNERLFHRREINFYGNFAPRTMPYPEAVKALYKYFLLAQEANDHLYSCYSLDPYLIISFICGEGLEDVYKKAIANKSFHKQHKESWAHPLSKYLLEDIEYVMGKRAVTDEEIEARLKVPTDGDAEKNFQYVDAGYLYLWQGNHEKAYQVHKKMYAIYRKQNWQEFGYTFWLLNYMIAICNHFQNLDSKEKKSGKIDCKKILKLIFNWTTDKPFILTVLYKIATGLYEVIHQNYEKAIALFDEAVLLAAKNSSPMFAAIANEQAAKIYLTLNKPKLAKPYVEEAYFYYSLWGAKLITERLQKEFPQWLKVKKELSSATTASSLDFLSILKSNQLISSEIVVKRLLTNMVSILLENSAAQKCVFIKISGNELVVEAEGVLLESQKVIQTNLIPISNYTEIPKSLISYVHRTKETLIFDNAVNESQFQNDPYMQRVRPKSILCTPILYHGETSGYLYLENNASEATFTQDRVQVIQILATQTAISFENAQIYESTTRFVPNQFLSSLNKKKLIEVHLGDHVEKEMTILFSDIRGFTTLSETMTPQENFDFINAYLAYMEPIITAHGGFIDKYIGDAIMALFEDPDDALQASLEMQEQLNNFNAHRKNHSEISIGIGLNTGVVMLGILGGIDRIEGSVIGDAVNVASRLESLTKVYHAKILISDSTYQKLTHRPPMKMRDKIQLKGKEELLKIWEIQ